MRLERIAWPLAGHFPLATWLAIGSTKMPRSWKKPASEKQEWEFELDEWDVCGMDAIYAEWAMHILQFSRDCMPGGRWRQLHGPFGRGEMKKNKLKKADKFSGAF